MLARAVDPPDIEMHLQAAGEALLAVHDHTTEHQDLLRRISAQVAALLNERGWSGDGQLAALLLEPPATASTRRRVRADLDQVADLLEGSLDMGFGGVLDMQTGDAWPESILDDWSLDEPCPDPDTDPERYLLTPNEGSRDARHNMHDFATGLADAHLQEQLLDAIDDRGASAGSRASSTATTTSGPSGTPTPPKPAATAPAAGSTKPGTTPSPRLGRPLSATEPHLLRRVR
jgi:hypothetical protein